MLRVAVTFIALAQAIAFSPASKARTVVSVDARSKSVPFLEQAPALDGKSPGDVGFDPLYLSSIWADRDWSYLVVPEKWLTPAERTPIRTIDWMKEAEIKHGRISMFAVVGWLAVDAGIRFPGSPYGSIPDSFSAHTAAVSNGSMGGLLALVALLELSSGAALYDQARGSGRAPGEFSFDPLGFGKDPKTRERYQTSEIKNGRLAMLAISGIVTQAAAFPEKSFPFF